MVASEAMSFLFQFWPEAVSTKFTIFLIPMNLFGLTVLFWELQRLEYPASKAADKEIKDFQWGPGRA